jgi:hypothetical protein
VSKAILDIHIYRNKSPAAVFPKVWHTYHHWYAAEIEFGRDSRRGKTMSLTLKYWQRILHMDNQELRSAMTGRKITLSLIVGRKE